MQSDKLFRTDHLPLLSTYFTEEGYLVDQPVVTMTGIFEYANPDGSIRRELRLPEEVFAQASLASYEGKPIVLSHAAGEVDKNNIPEEIVGTVLSPGIPDGEKVRAKIIIHDTNALQSSGLRELSLGYSLSLEECPGIWQGHPYDAIQRNIEINHLALVKWARAGSAARLNIDHKSEGGIGVLSKSKSAGDTRPEPEKEKNSEKMEGDWGLAEDLYADYLQKLESLQQSNLSSEETIGLLEGALQDLDRVIVGLALKLSESSQNGEVQSCRGLKQDSQEMPDLAKLAHKLNLPGLESMDLLEAQKAVLAKARPKLNLAGRSPEFIEAAFSLVMEELSGVNGQRKQVFNGDGYWRSRLTGAEKARQNMIARRKGDC